jgi:hypothetical protein
LGYQQTDGNRFVRSSRYRDPFKNVRTSASSHLLGVGAASYSHGGARRPEPSRRGYIFRNEPDVRRYLAAVQEGPPPIATGRTIDAAEMLATYATGLRNGRVEDRDLQLARLENPELSHHYDRLVHDLVGLGVLKEYLADGGLPAVGLTELGRLFEDETACAVLQSCSEEHAGDTAADAGRGHLTASVASGCPLDRKNSSRHRAEQMLRGRPLEHHCRASSRA